MNKMGGMMGLLTKLPGMNAIPQAVKNQLDESLFVKIEAMIGSMTPLERTRPDIIRGSRKRRIAAGSGTQIQDINRLLKQFDQMQKMMKKFSSPGKMAKMMRHFKGSCRNNICACHCEERSDVAISSQIFSPLPSGEVDARFLRGG